MTHRLGFLAELSTLIRQTEMAVNHLSTLLSPPGQLLKLRFLITSTYIFNHFLDDTIAAAQEM